MDVYPKISKLAENMNDFVCNINYSIDRMFLINDLLCDENILQKNNTNLEKKLKK